MHLFFARLLPLLSILSVSAAPGRDFTLARDGHSAPIYVAADAPRAVVRAAGDLAEDFERVTGIKGKVARTEPTTGSDVVLIGVLHQDARIDALVRSGRLDVSGVAGEVESWVRQVVDRPWPGVARALVIAGSDRRGAIYGAYDLSEEIGVSPWYWWADVPVTHRSRLFVRTAVKRQGPPAVRYRGIFLNDEDWGLRPWAAQTLDPATGNIGAKTYARIFELLLRLKANYCWPAMHPQTRAFNSDPQAAALADDYGIVMGSSHCEQMLRDNVAEWPRDGHGEYNYVTNRTGVLAYWDARVQANARYENVYTVGMRGVHDEPMPGGGTLDERAARLQSIIADQRSILRHWVNPNPAMVPQIFCPYKEVLDIYHRMGSLPDDISLVWPDDDYGYIRQFPSAAERRRSGGSGVYYHVSYWGAPYDYLWLCSTPPALIREEMTKAWDSGARTVWMLNVGDLKPAELDLEFFLQLAWSPHAIPASGVESAIGRIFARDFGPGHAAEMAALATEYYRLNFARRPEHMGLDPANRLLARQVFTAGENDDAGRRERAWAALRNRTEALALAIPAEQQDAFFQLLLYPVRAAALMNQKGLALGRGATAAAQTAEAAIQRETAYYNETMSGGKWRFMMSANPHDKAVFGVPATPRLVTPSPPTTRPSVPHFAGSAPGDFVESAGQIELSVAHASARVEPAGAKWEMLPGLGYNGSDMSLRSGGRALNQNLSQLSAANPSLEYIVWVVTPGRWTVSVRTLPTWPAVTGRPQRFAVAWDDSPPVTLELPSYQGEKDPRWQEDVLRNAAVCRAELAVPASGRHRLRLWTMDAGIVFDSLLLQAGAGRSAGYLWPEETRLKSDSSL